MHVSCEITLDSGGWANLHSAPYFSFTSYVKVSLGRTLVVEFKIGADHYAVLEYKC